MKKHNSLDRLSQKAVLIGLLIGILSMVLFVSAAWAAPTNSPNLQETSTPHPENTLEKECSDCHPDINNSWSVSPHANAFSDEVFSKRWDSLGEPGECLVCHTTGYQMTTNSYKAEGVQCEACHGDVVEGHPPQVVPISADTDYCGSCHTTTLGEWRLTGHASAGVDCMDCHDPHSQKALFDNPDEMCLNCHREDMGAYLEDIHIKKNIGCVDCHALVIPPDSAPVDGIVPTGHSFTITPATCVACHTDSLHSGFSLPGYEDGAKSSNGETTATEVPDLSALIKNSENNSEESGLTSQQQIQALQASLASSRLSSLFQGGIIGLVFGSATVYFLARNRRREGEEEGSGDISDQSSPDEVDIIDRFLDKTETYFAKIGDRWKAKKTKTPPDSGEGSHHE